MNRILKIGLVLLALGSGPLLLYILFGPEDGNPIGLGLLFFFTFPAALVCLVLGGVRHLLEKDPEDGEGAGRPGPLQGGSPGADRGHRFPGRTRRTRP